MCENPSVRTFTLTEDAFTFLAEQLEAARVDFDEAISYPANGYTHDDIVRYRRRSMELNRALGLAELVDSTPVAVVDAPGAPLDDDERARFAYVTEAGGDGLALMRATYQGRDVAVIVAAEEHDEHFDFWPLYLAIDPQLLTELTPPDGAEEVDNT